MVVSRWGLYTTMTSGGAGGPVPSPELRQPFRGLIGLACLKIGKY